MNLHIDGSMQKRRYSSALAISYASFASSHRYVHEHFSKTYTVRYHSNHATSTGQCKQDATTMHQQLFHILCANTLISIFTSRNAPIIQLTTWQIIYANGCLCTINSSHSPLHCYLGISASIYYSVKYHKFSNRPATDNMIILLNITI